MLEPKTPRPGTPPCRLRWGPVALAAWQGPGTGLVQSPIPLESRPGGGAPLSRHHNTCPQRVCGASGASWALGHLLPAPLPTTERNGGCAGGGDKGSGHKLQTHVFCGPGTRRVSGAGRPMCRAGQRSARALGLPCPPRGLRALCTVALWSNITFRAGRGGLEEGKVSSYEVKRP